MDVAPICSERLSLVSMGTEFLRRLIAGDREGAQGVVDYAIPPGCPLPEQPWAKRRLELIEADPDQHPWMFRAIVRNEDRTMVGHISFHHKAPDPDLLEYASHAAELGYTIAPEFRRNGYARESAIAMMSWANQSHGVGSFLICVSPENEPSMRMATSMGFRKIAEYQDPIDGLEFVMRAEIDQVLAGSPS